MAEGKTAPLERRLLFFALTAALSIITAVGIPLLYWIGTSVQKLEVVVGQQSVHISNMSDKINALALKTDKFYAESAAEKVHSGFEAAIKELDLRVDKLEIRKRDAN